MVTRAYQDEKTGLVDPETAAVLKGMPATEQRQRGFDKVSSCRRLVRQEKRASAAASAMAEVWQRTCEHLPAVADSQMEEPWDC